MPTWLEYCPWLFTLALTNDWIHSGGTGSSSHRLMLERDQYNYDHRFLSTTWLLLLVPNVWVRYTCICYLSSSSSCLVIGQLFQEYACNIKLALVYYSSVKNNIIDNLFEFHYSMYINFVYVFIVLCRWACGGRVVAVLWLLGWCCQTRFILNKCQRVLVPVSEPLSLVHLSLQGNTSL